MILPLKRLLLVLRISGVGLVLLSVLAVPMYSNWCETHQLGHELAALGHEQFRTDSSSERQLDADHARGAHGLLHGDEAGVYADIAAVVTMPVVHFDSVLNPLSIALPAPVQRMVRPFRPPIA